jgi:hypothetical protein
MQEFLSTRTSLIRLSETPEKLAYCTSAGRNCKRITDLGYATPFWDIVGEPIPSAPIPSPSGTKMLGSLETRGVHQRLRTYDH